MPAVWSRSCIPDETHVGYIALLSSTHPLRVREEDELHPLAPKVPQMTCPQCGSNTQMSDFACGFCGRERDEENDDA